MAGMSSRGIVAQISLRRWATREVLGAGVEYYPTREYVLTELLMIRNLRQSIQNIR